MPGGRRVLFIVLQRQNECQQRLPSKSRKLQISFQLPGVRMSGGEGGRARKLWVVRIRRQSLL